MKIQFKQMNNDFLAPRAYEEVLKSENEPNSFINKPTLSIILTIVCLVGDLAFFYSALSPFQADSSFIVAVGCVCLLIGFDIGPWLLGYVYRMHSQGYKIKKTIPAIFIVGFLLAFSVYAYQRYAAKDVVLPGESTSTSTMEEEEQEQENPMATPMAIIVIVAPVITSLITFGASYLGSNPLKMHKNKTEKRLLEIRRENVKIREILEESKADKRTREQAVREEQLLFKAALNQLSEQGKECADYVRERLKEHLKDPAAINRLSEPVYEKIAALLEDDSTEKLVESIMRQADETLFPEEDTLNKLIIFDEKNWRNTI